MKISNKDKKLLVYLAAVAIVAATYFFLAKPLLDKWSVMNDEIAELEMQLEHYSKIYMNQGDYEANIAAAQIKYDDIFSKFFGGLDQENSIMLVKNIEDAANVWISRISFQETQLALGEENLGEPSEGEQDENSEEGGSVVDFSGVKQNLSLEYSCKYDDYKRFLEYVENYNQRLYISELNSTYSVDSGLVSGTLELTQYAVLGTDKEYKAPDLSGINLGVDNIFSANSFVSEEAINDTAMNSEVSTGEISEDEENSTESSDSDENKSEEKPEAEREEEPASEPSSKPKQGGGII